MTASTPPLVDVIAEVLAGHGEHSFGREESDSSRWFDKCDCGHLLFSSDHSPEHRMYPGKSYAAAAHAAHQARAVLAALEQAGGVEWGVRRVGYPAVRQHSGEGSARWTVEECALEGHPEQVVSRITGPWTAVEG